MFVISIKSFFRFFLKIFFLIILLLKITTAFSQSKHPYNLTPFQQGELWGYKDKATGKIIIPAQYNFADYLFSNGVTKVEKSGKAGLINNFGKEIISCKYDDIEWDIDSKSYINNFGLIKTKAGNKYGLANSSGVEIASCKYDEISPFANNVAQVISNGKKGYINLSGKEIAPCIFDDISVHNNLLFASKNKKIKLFNIYNRPIKPNEYDSVTINFYKGNVITKKNNLYGFVDTLGKEVVPCIYDKIIFDTKKLTYFPNNKASVIKKGKYGLIDITGKVIVPCEYDWEVHLPIYTEYHDVTKNGLLGIIDRNGKEIIPCKYDEINWDAANTNTSNDTNYKKENILFSAKYQDNWGLIDKKNNIIIPFKYESLESFSKGLAVAGLKGKFGYINIHDSVVIPFNYDYCQNFDEDCAIAGYYQFDTNKNMINKFGLIDKKGKNILPFEYSIYYLKDQKLYVFLTKDQKVGIAFSDGKIMINPTYNLIPFLDSYANDKLIKVFIIGLYKMGFYNEKGELIIPFIYDDATYFNEDFVAVCRSLKWGFVNKKGQEKVLLAYDAVNNFSEGMAVVKHGMKYGYVDTSGTEKIPIQYFQASNFANGYAKVQLMNALFGIINKENKIIIPTTQENILFDTTKNSFFSDGLALVQQKSKFGYYNENGNQTIQNKYIWADFFRNDKAIVEDSNRDYHFIDKNGDYLFNAKYKKAFNFYKGYAVVNTGNTYQMIDTLGNVFKTLHYDEIKPFIDGPAAVKKGNLWGFIGSKGNEIISSKYEYASSFRNGEAIVKIDDEMYFINIKGEIENKVIKK